MAQALLSYSRKTLSEGPRDVRAPLPATWLTTELAAVAVEGDIPFRASADGAIDAVLSPAGGDNFLLRGQVHASVETECARCLGPAKLEVEGDLTLLLVPSQADAHRKPKGKRHKESEGEFEFAPEEGDIAHYDGEVVVLDHLVREAILLELPISALCSPDCPGMTAGPIAGAVPEAPRVNPRLAKLAELRDQFPAGKK